MNVLRSTFSIGEGFETRTLRVIAKRILAIGYPFCSFPSLDTALVSSQLYPITRLVGIIQDEVLEINKLSRM